MIVDTPSLIDEKIGWTVFPSSNLCFVTSPKVVVYGMKYCGSQMKSALSEWLVCLSCYNVARFDIRLYSAVAIMRPTEALASVKF